MKFLIDSLLSTLESSFSELRKPILFTPDFLKSSEPPLFEYYFLGVNADVDLCLWIKFRTPLNRIWNPLSVAQSPRIPEAVWRQEGCYSLEEQRTCHISTTIGPILSYIAVFNHRFWESLRSSQRNLDHINPFLRGFHMRNFNSDNCK